MFLAVICAHETDVLSMLFTKMRAESHEQALVIGADCGYGFLAKQIGLRLFSLFFVRLFDRGVIIFDVFYCMQYKCSRKLVSARNTNKKKVFITFEYVFTFNLFVFRLTGFRRIVSFKDLRVHGPSWKQFDVCGVVFHSQSNGLIRHIQQPINKRCWNFNFKFVDEQSKH